MYFAKNIYLLSRIVLYSKVSLVSMAFVSDSLPLGIDRRDKNLSDT